MKALVISLFFVFLFSSCLTNKKISRNCDRFFQVCGVPETKIVYRDTTIHLNKTIETPIDQDSIAVVGDVFIKDGKAHMDKKKIESKLITVEAEIRNGKMEIYSYINKETIPITLNMDITLERAIKEKKEVRTIKLKYIPKFYKISFWIVIAQLALLVVFILQKFSKLNPVGILKNFVLKLFR